MNSKDAIERLLFLKQLDYVEGGPFAPDFKEAIQLGIDALAKLKRYEEREHLVQMLVQQVEADSPEYTTSTLEVTAKAVRDFKL